MDLYLIYEIVDDFFKLMNGGIIENYNYDECEFTSGEFLNICKNYFDEINSNV
jgi:hypothetical protein